MLPSEVCLIFRWNTSILDDILHRILHLNHIISVQGLCPLWLTESVTFVQYKTADSVHHTIKCLRAFSVIWHMLFDTVCWCLEFHPPPFFMVSPYSWQNVLLGLWAEILNVSECMMWVSGIVSGCWTMSGRPQAEQNIPQALSDLLLFSNTLSTSVTINSRQCKRYIDSYHSKTVPDFFFFFLVHTPQQNELCVGREMWMISCMMVRALLQWKTWGITHPLH